MAYRLNEIGRRLVMLDLIVILVVAAFIVLVSAVLLLSATILVPGAIFRLKVLSLLWDR